MTHPSPSRCPCCGYAKVVPAGRPGRVLRYRNTALTLPPDLSLSHCQRCKYEDLSLAALPGELLESLYRSSLRERAQLAIARLHRHLSKNKLELLLNLSHGYLCRLGAGHGVPSAALVSLLTLLAEHPDLLRELEAYWTLPPGDGSKSTHADEAISASRKTPTPNRRYRP
ncbi:type II toxin-antitoxin system MqsA family antitoxin [Haliangium sp. UPWRP_2]|uniref:type II toxin-antitoxin system MqsA family antitoxin n=1 Tax=Haliangium sp. UPWRP_2 TaxID=1931276 RepID=UPI001304E8B2|nr:type II toxin-antitoxin system MqsA family antitoxin [Haliangium sp. UPWRP_2]